MSLYSITFCQQFVHWSLILTIVLLMQIAFSYSLSTDLLLLIRLPFVQISFIHNTLLDIRLSIFASCNLIWLFILAYFSAVLTIMGFLNNSLSFVSFNLITCSIKLIWYPTRLLISTHLNWFLTFNVASLCSNYILLAIRSLISNS